MNKKSEKAAWAIGKIALALAIFYFMPAIQKKLADKIYREI